MNAIIEASRSREELGRDLAAIFLADPATFDPSGLRRLGQAGLRSFAIAVGVSVPNFQSPSGAAQEQIASRDAADWKLQESRIVPFEIVGSIHGALAGLAAIVAISLLSWLFG
ncbi:hypothetical protein [Bradyrhizobium sp. BR 1432]|uniref:hypothetical protein n=1 Tax=Bradyrhizobium sp. BR 1432 TaxID=3447966 RepID=UPI003EE6C84E